MMNPQQGGLDFNDPKVQQAWAVLQMQQQQQQQQAYMMQQYYAFCQQNGLNPNDPNSQYIFSQFMNSGFINQNMNPVNNQFINQVNNQYTNQVNNQYTNQTANANTNNQSNYINSNDSKEIKPSSYQHTNAKQPEEVIPRRLDVLYVKDNEIKMTQNNVGMGMGLGGGNIVNVTLTATSGLKVVIPAPGNMSFKDLFIQYVHKVGIPESVIGTKIVFLFNAEKLDVNSLKPINTSFKHFTADVTVLDQGNIIGA